MCSCPDCSPSPPADASFPPAPPIFATSPSFYWEMAMAGTKKEVNHGAVEIAEGGFSW